MKYQSLIYITPHNWYNHVKKNSTNRPLKFAEEMYNKAFFNKVLIVNRINPKKMIRNKNETRKIVLKAAFFNIFYDEENEVHYLEHSIPFGRLEKIFLPHIINFVKKKLKLNDSLLWISDPKSAILLKNIKYFSIFDAYDDWTLSPFYQKKARHLKYIKRGYNIAKNYADVILTNTNYMKKKLENNKNNIYYVSNTSSLASSGSAPTLLGENNVGYIGNIHERIDLILLESLLINFKDTTFNFYGKNEFEGDEFTRLLSKHENLKFHGVIPYDQISERIKSFSVCIVPHIVNDYTLSQDSMKIYDYLSVGKPIVSTKIPPSEFVTDLIYVAENAEDFKQKLNIALKETRDDLIEARKSYISNNSWRKKVEYIYTIVGEPNE